MFSMFSMCNVNIPEKCSMEDKKLLQDSSRCKDVQSVCLLNRTNVPQKKEVVSW